MDRAKAYHTPNELSETTVIRPIVVSVSLLQHVSGAITDMINADIWDEVGVPIADVLKELNAMTDLYYTPWMVGMIQAFISQTMPPGWFELTSGVTVAQADYPELTAVAPAVWKVGANIVIPAFGSNCFLGSAAGFLGNQGTIGGNLNNEVTLNNGNMPIHTHLYNQLTTFNIDLEGPGIPDPLAVGLPHIPTATGQAGGSGGNVQPFNILPRFMRVFWGIFAGRQL